MDDNCRGDVNNTVLDLLGGIRSACTYTGARKLKASLYLFRTVDRKVFSKIILFSPNLWNATNALKIYVCLSIGR